MATESEVKFLGTEGTEQLVATIKDQIADKLSVTKQTLTPEQQAQARTNIGITGTGADGKTPVKGTDYYTEADKEEMVSAVIASLPIYNGEVVTV